MPFSLLPYRRHVFSNQLIPYGRRRRLSINIPVPPAALRPNGIPAKQALVCGFCGTVTPFSVDASGQVRELDLAAALRDIPDEDRGWMAEKRTVQCQSCKAVSVFDPERVGQNCDFCGSPALVPYEEIKAPIRPESLLPFKVTDVQVREQIRRWYGSKWLAPNALRRRRARRSRARRLHSLLDLRRACRLSVGGRSRPLLLHDRGIPRQSGAPQTRQVRHVRWEPASGEVRHFFDDEPVPGTQGVSRVAAEGDRAVSDRRARALQHRLLSGFVVEHYRVVLLEAAEYSQVQMKRKLHDMCARQVPGDTHRNLEISPTFSGRTFKHVLVPVWLLTYTYGTNRGR